MNSTSTSNINSNHIEHIKAHMCTARCFSWTAIFLGAITAISLSFLLNLLSLAIGLSAFPTSSDGQITFAVGGFIGLLICAVLAMFPAGYVAGFLGRANCLRRKSGELYGLAAWGLALILTMLLASSVGQFVSQATYLVNRQPVAVRLNEVNDNALYKVNQKTTGVTVEVDNDKAKQATSLAILATFLIFFMGFIAACFGGRLGMMCKRKLMLNEAHCCQCQGNKSV